MTDRTAVLWSRYDGQPRKIADVAVNDTQARIVYDAGAPLGVSLLHDPRELVGLSVPFPVEAALPLPPPLAAMTPPRDAPLWCLLEARAGRHRPISGYDLWPTMLEGGRDGIGHLEAFESDAAAETHYGEARLPRVLGADDAGLLDVFRALTPTTMTDAVMEDFDRHLGPTPGVVGMIPKILATVDRGWLEPGATGSVRPLVKTEPSKYEGLLALEATCYEVYRRAGCKTPAWWLKETPGGSPLLVTERFDRPAGEPIPCETAYSVLRWQTGGKLRHRWSDPDAVGEYRHEGEIVPRLESVAALVAGPEAVVDLAIGQGRELFRRVALALMTGNSDLHLENLSFLGPRGETRLSPVYDPAPMRAYREHAMTLALDFAHLGANRSGRKSDLWEAFISFGATLGMDRGAAVEILLTCRDATEGYIDLVRDHATPRREVLVARSMNALSDNLDAERRMMAGAIR